MCDYCRRMRDLNDALKVENEELKDRLYSRKWAPPPELRLTPVEAVIVSALLRGRTVPDSELFEVTRGTPGTFAGYDSDPSNLIKSKIVHIRRKFGRFGLKLENQWGWGYRLPDETRRRLLNWKWEEMAA